ncbi:MAG: SIR2 family protein [Chloroflexi bacterium]|nr:SIR2 family protein [Chloroflexota bacterium]
MANDQDTVINELCRIYADVPEIGLMLGAGVTKESGVPNWRGLALEFFERARNRRFLRGAPRTTVKLLEDELSRWRSGQTPNIELDPEKILQFVCDHIKPKGKVQELIKQVLYEGKIETKSHGMVAARTFRENKTLDAVITFCAAVGDSPIASAPGGRWQTNRKVGAILTTNYDNLVEGSFNSKYGKHLLHPVAREGAREVFRDRRIIPVYHMHGYVSHVDDPKSPDLVKASDLVLTEKDYYQTFYNLLGFGNMAAASFFRQFHSIFVGCSMTDRNVRRILYHLRRERLASSQPRRHFAILPRSIPERDDFDDAVLASFGVVSIRIDGGERGERIGSEVDAILKRVYLSAEGVHEEHWLEARRGSWKRGKQR